MRLWAQPEKAKYLNFSAEIAGKIQDWFERYTGIEYQTEKMGKFQPNSKIFSPNNIHVFLFTH